MLLPENPTVGPPVRIWLPPTPVSVTQMLPAAQVPPVVTVAVATNVVPWKTSKVVAEATGTTAKAMSTEAKIESLRLVIRTTDPPLGVKLVMQQRITNGTAGAILGEKYIIYKAMIINNLHSVQGGLIEVSSSSMQSPAHYVLLVR
jgi:hypothetical protein